MMSLKPNIIFLIAIVILSACATTKDIQNNKGVQSITNGDVTHYLISTNLKDSSELSYHFEFFNETEKLRPYQDSINEMIFQHVKISTEFERSEKVGVLSETYFKEQLEKFGNLFHSEELEDSPLWSMEGAIEINDSYTSFAELSLSGWSYTGGAHGNGFSSYFMFNKADGKELYLSDFVRDTEELTRIAEPIFRAMFELTPSESLNEYGFWFKDDKFSLNENFYFSDDSMIFYYNSYEIAPYSGGPTELEIPLTRIAHLLKLDVS